MRADRTQLFIECDCEKVLTALEMQAVGLGTLFFRWEMIGNRRSPSNPDRSLDIDIPDFRESDLVLIKSYPGVTKVERFTEPDLAIPTALARRRELLERYVSDHAAA